MAEVYDHVPGVPGSSVARTLPNGDVKHSRANQLERVIALHQDAQRALIAEGMKIQSRAKFRLEARQQRHVLQLRQELYEAVRGGDPDEIKWAQYKYNYYVQNKTTVVWSQADVDFHISLYRPDGREFFVEVDGEGDRGIEVLKKSLTG